MTERPLLSVVATLYRSAPGLAEFHARATAAARALAGDSYEIVFVNDGSPDDSLDRAIAIAGADPHVVVVDLSRNFGHHKAMMTGLDHARGERIFLIDSDLEEDPAWLAEFDGVMARTGSDMVYGVQATRKGGTFERWSGEAFYTLFNWGTGLNLPRNLVTARLMTRRYVEALLLHREREVFLAGLLHITGFAQTPVEVLKLSLSPTQPLMLQGQAGYSRKGPKPEQASHYYSQPHLKVSGTITREKISHSVAPKVLATLM